MRHGVDVGGPVAHGLHVDVEAGIAQVARHRLRHVGVLRVPGGRRQERDLGANQPGVLEQRARLRRVVLVIAHGHRVLDGLHERVCGGAGAEQHAVHDGLLVHRVVRRLTGAKIVERRLGDIEREDHVAPVDGRHREGGVGLQALHIGGKDPQRHVGLTRIDEERPRRVVADELERNGLEERLGAVVVVVPGDRDVVTRHPLHELVGSGADRLLSVAVAELLDGGRIEDSGVRVREVVTQSREQPIGDERDLRVAVDAHFLDRAPDRRLPALVVPHAIDRELDGLRVDGRAVMEGCARPELQRPRRPVVADLLSGDEIRLRLHLLVERVEPAVDVVLQHALVPAHGFARVDVRKFGGNQDRQLVRGTGLCQRGPPQHEHPTHEQWPREARHPLRSAMCLHSRHVQPPTGQGTVPPPSVTPRRRHMEITRLSVARYGAGRRGPSGHG